MSEKPEAFCEANYEILRVTNSGEFIWNENADQMIRDPVFTEANPAIIHVVRALRQAEVIRQENERLREALEKIATVNAMDYEYVRWAKDALRRDASTAPASAAMEPATEPAIRARGEVPR